MRQAMVRVRRKAHGPAARYASGTTARSVRSHRIGEIRIVRRDEQSVGRLNDVDVVAVWRISGGRSCYAKYFATTGTNAGCLTSARAKILPNVRRDSGMRFTERASLSKNASSNRARASLIR